MCRIVSLLAFATLVRLSDAATSLNLWIIPIENAAPGQTMAGEQIVNRVQAFNERFSTPRLTVENTTDPVLKMQLLSWNPAFAVPNAAVVTSQEATLQVLAQYCEQSGVNVHVRFITWDEAFPLISSLNPGVRSSDYPDVIQIGSTWRAYLAARHVTMSRPNWASDRGNWVDLPGLPASTLHYWTDVRLLFYWKRLPSASPTSPEFVLNSSSWPALIDSIRTRAGSSDTITFPTGLTLNVLHDYAPLVWAGGGTFLSRAWLGWHVDLTSRAALSIPLQLQKSAIEFPKPGQPRTLITFPESSHEEVDRTFVNGGYRVTLEPANFIGRWVHDFEQRHKNDGLRFWDYAAAAVPPVTFKGGSDLVVTRGTPNPAAAFALADFLAGDARFTKILAESGFLPSGRSGYGADILTKALYNATGSLSDAEHFVDSAQKAIEQGVEYPPFPEWPTEIETLPVQEGFQIIWRRMGERDPDKLRQAAAQAEWLINSHIDGIDQFWNGVLEARWALVAILFLACSIAGYFIYRRLQADRGLMLLLFLYRAFRHDAAKFLGDNFFGIASEAESENQECRCFIEKVKALSEHFKNDLAPYIEGISEGQFRDFSRRSYPMRLDEISELAFRGATYIFKAKELQDAPYIQYVAEGLDRWQLTRMPYSLVVALEEWFLNTIKHVSGNDVRHPVLIIKSDGHALTIQGSGSLAERDKKALLQEPGLADLSVGRQGLKLIRNILFYAYKSRVDVENASSTRGDPRVRLIIPMNGYLKSL